MPVSLALERVIFLVTLWVVRARKEWHTFQGFGTQWGNSGKSTIHWLLTSRNVFRSIGNYHFLSAGAVQPLSSFQNTQAKHVGCQFRNPDDCWDMDSQRTFRESPQICIAPPESCPFRTTVVRGNPIRFSDPGIWSKSRIGYAAGYFDSWSYTIVLYSQLIKSVNRLIAIVRPAFYYYRCNIPNTQKVILFVWIASALECAPQAFGKCRWHLKF